MKQANKTNKIARIILVLLCCVGCNANVRNDKILLDSLFKSAFKNDSIDDYNASIMYYNQILNMNSNNSIALQNRGTALVHINKIREGFFDLNKAVKLYPREDTYCTRALCFMFLNKVDSAEMDLEKAKTYKPYLGNVSITFKKTQILNHKVLPNETYYASSKLELMKGDTFSALTLCETADRLGYNGKFSEELKAKISKKYGVEIVNNYDYDKIMHTIDSLPIIKEVVNKSIANHDYSKTVSLEALENGIYILKVECSSKQFTFKMDARTLKVLNPDGKIE